jgi:uncharacterized protein
MRREAMPLFFLLSMTAILLMGWFTGGRLVTALGLEGRTALWVWLPLGLLLLAPLAAMIARRSGSAALAEAFAAPGWIVLGWASVALILLLGADLLRLLVWAGDGLGRIAGLESALDEERRRFLTRTLHLGAFAASAALTGLGWRSAMDHTRTVEVAVPVVGLHPDLEGLRIVQFSDLHIGSLIRGEQVEAVAERLAELQGDLLVFTGDLADGLPGRLAGEAASLAKPAGRLGKYFVTGNHEYYSDPQGWMRTASSLGFDVLTDEHRVHRVGEATLVVAGVPDISAPHFLREHASSPQKALDGAPSADFKLLLAHQPRSIFEAAKAGYDLVLSGHTHGGQYHPWTWAADKVNPYLAGLNRHDEQTWIYVSRGTGFWGPPIRLGAPPEITVLTLTRA